MVTCREFTADMDTLKSAKQRCVHAELVCRRPELCYRTTAMDGGHQTAYEVVACSIFLVYLAC